MAQEFKRMWDWAWRGDAIQSATSRAAEMLDMKARSGWSLSGAFADIVAGERRSAEGCWRARALRFVMKGRPVFQNELANKS